MKKIVVACDSFKGSLTSAQANSACAQALRECFPKADIREVAVGDGGEGTGAALHAAFGCVEVSADAVDPLGRPVEAAYHISKDNRTAIIELAAASGLTLLSDDERNPLAASTYGTGMLIADAVGRGCRDITLCVGGTATNDGATGIMQALGIRFYDRKGSLLAPGAVMLEHINTVDTSCMMPTLAEVRFTLYTDVDNVLCSPDGASFTFAPQKGATAEMCRRLDDGLANLSRILVGCGCGDVADMPGAGAGGGVGFGMASVFGAKIQRGADAVLRAIGFRHIVEGAELVVTGEGRLDLTTLHGKMPYTVLKNAGGIPVAAFGGSVTGKETLLYAGFADAVAIKPPDMPLETAMRPEVARQLLYDAVSAYCQNS